MIALNVEREFRDALDAYQKHNQDGKCLGCDERPLVITPFEGEYGRAGTVIVVNGTPPHGRVIVFGKHANMLKEIHVRPCGGKMRELNLTRPTRAGRRLIESIQHLLAEPTDEYPQTEIWHGSVGGEQEADYTDNRQGEVRKWKSP